ncbi:MAG: prolipoprotein diacylglyceryl transferase [Minisyncoccota bacterium]
MSSMIYWWQHIPEILNPIVYTVGFFTLYWYALCLLVGCILTLFIALYLALHDQAPCTSAELFDLAPILIVGALVGGRLGYGLIYNFDMFWTAPWKLVMPYDVASGIWIGIAGMSYHGGVLGVLVVLWWFSRKRGITFLALADFVAVLAPFMTFWGRLGNFFTLELYGRVTEKPWGMLFPGVYPEGTLRHPSALYEALFEGVVLLGIVLVIRRKVHRPGILTCLYLILYAVFRFGMEFFRQPDSQLGFVWNGFTMGQILSLGMLGMASIFLVWLKSKKCATISGV